MELQNCLPSMKNDYKGNEISDQQEVININNTQGWVNSSVVSMQSHDIMIPVPIKMQQSLNVLDPNNIAVNNANMPPQPSVIHTSPQTPHVCINC